jgi:RimJ/RimL family protein N-acetyltransferase
VSSPAVYRKGARTIAWQDEAMSVDFRHVVLPEDLPALAEFLCSNDWPFHMTPRLSPSEVVGLDFVIDDECDSFWITDDGANVGLIRLFDLGDVEDGSPLFDLRIAESARGRGLGTTATVWLTTHLFHRFSVLHRIEATTRQDNAAMRRVLERCGYRLEGQLVEAWKNHDGTRSDTMIYGILRVQRPPASADPHIAEGAD